MFANRNVDPELEKLRKEVDGPPNLDTVALNIQKVTANVHASYLFEHIGKATLQKLCLLLSSTSTGKTYNGWQEFAAHMGLTMEQIRYIDEHHLKGLQDPTYYVLLAYVQYGHATIDKILNALVRIHRYDVINQIKDNVYELIREVPRDTGPGSTIIKPESIPRAPLILTPIISNSIQKTQDDKVGTDHIKQDNPQKTKQSCGCVVMLTFADDGVKTAQHVTKIFRSKQPRIGVLILQEQENYVYSRAEEFIHDCFKQVHFVIPILTKGYIDRICNLKMYIEEDQNKLDFKYVKYIYSLFTNEYVKNQCINNRVRCIVPDSDVSTVVKANLHPTLQAWFRESDIDEFADNILLRKCSK